MAGDGTALFTALRRSLSSGSGRHPSDERMSSWYLLRLSSLVQQSQTGPREEQEASSLGSSIRKGPGLEDDGTETRDYGNWN